MRESERMEMKTKIVSPLWNFTQLKIIIRLFLSILMVCLQTPADLARQKRNIDIAEMIDNYQVRRL